MGQEKPKVLYRGVTISYDLLKDFHFDGYPLVPPNEPKIDAQGRKTVGDGNEYGVYMTDNFTMADYAYGKPTTGGKPLLRRFDERDDISMPEVGIIYEINTDGLDIREPWISSQLRGHYNNGFEGKEWIADEIPEANYSIKKVSIGRDLLHDEEVIPLFGNASVEEYTKERVEGRYKRLEAFAKDMEKVPYSKRMRWSMTHQNFLRDVYGENGAKYQKPESMKVVTAEDAVRYLVARSYRENPDPEKFDSQEMNFLGFLKSKVKGKPTLTPEDLQELIQEATAKMVDRRNDLAGRGKPTITVDRTIKKYEDYMSALDEKLKSKETNKETDRNVDDDIK